MKKKSLIIVALLSIILFACEEPTNTTQTQIHKGAGIVDDDPSAIIERTGSSLDIYHFGSLDNITPATRGFKTGEYVYFEAEKIYWNGNDYGGTTYWCKLLLIRKYN